MNLGDKPDLCVHHHPCHDGFAAAWAIGTKWPDVSFLPAKYGDPPPLELAKDAHVLIVDFSYPEDDLRDLALVARRVTVLDHHQSAKSHLEALLEERVIEGVFDLTQSGAVLAWKYAWGGAMVPFLIEVVQDRDLWRFEIPSSREAHALLSSHPYDFEVWKRLAHRLEDPGRRVGAIEEGAAILRAQDKALVDLLQITARTMVIGGVEVPVANVPYAMASDAGHILGVGHEFAATYFDRADGMRSFSLRSGPEGADVSEIAVMYGGGGHPHAAGFTIKAPSDEKELGRAKAAETA